ncbi:MAG: hypothetical protein SVU32_02810, partial [Candidatus Nanohaloarchaea archaeon]|nr:hypothetical protein [Candidatus Nanohaloarchaea archaeon]
MMRRHIYLIFAVLLLAPFAAGQQSQENGTGLVEEQKLQIGIDERREITPRIGNRLSAQDNITLTLTGRAISEGLLLWNVNETAEYIECNSGETVCNVTIDARSSRELSIVLQGAMVGQGS